jgi:hypothetical protein
MSHMHSGTMARVQGWEGSMPCAGRVHNLPSGPNPNDPVPSPRPNLVGKTSEDGSKLPSEYAITVDITALGRCSLLPMPQ